MASQSLPVLVCTTTFGARSQNYVVSIAGGQDPDSTIVKRFLEMPGTKSLRGLPEMSTELSKPTASKFIFSNEAQGFELIVTTKSATRLMGLLTMTFGKQQIASPVFCKVTNEEI